MDQEPEQKPTDAQRVFLTEVLVKLEQMKTRLTTEGEAALRRRIGTKTYQMRFDTVTELLATMRVNDRLRKLDRRRQRAS